MSEPFATPATTCAQAVMESLPLVMRAIGEMHHRRPNGISAPQFHAMMILKHHQGASLSLVAEHMKSGLPSASKLVDGLVERGYITRETSPRDHRRMLLALTDAGRDALETMRREATAFVASTLERLPEEDYAIIIQAMQLLRRAFAPALTAPCAPRQGD